MNKRQKDVLAEIGLTTESYYVDSYYVESEKLGEFWRPPIWGLALKRGDRDVFVIEQSPRAHGGDGMYHMRECRTDVSAAEPGPSLGAYKLQRLAVVGVIRQMYGLLERD
jgi:hypothetical protein